MSKLNQLLSASALLLSIAGYQSVLASATPTTLNFHQLSQAPTLQPTYLAQQEYIQLQAADAPVSATAKRLSVTKKSSTLKNSLLVNAQNAPALYQLVADVYQLLQCELPTIAIFNRAQSKAWLDQNELAYAVRYSPKNRILYLGHELVKKLSDTELQTVILDTLWQQQNSFSGATFGRQLLTITKTLLTAIEVVAVGVVAVLAVGFLVGLTSVSASALLPLAAITILPIYFVSVTAGASHRLIDYIVPENPGATPVTSAPPANTADLAEKMELLAPRIATVRHKIKRLQS